MDVSCEDSEAEEDTGGAGMNVDHMGPGLLSAQGEIVVDDPDDVLPDLQLLSIDGDVMSVVEDETMLDLSKHGNGDEVADTAGPRRKKSRDDPAAEPTAKLSRL